MTVYDRNCRALPDCTSVIDLLPMISYERLREASHHAHGHEGERSMKRRTALLALTAGAAAASIALQAQITFSGIGYLPSDPSNPQFESKAYAISFDGS